MDCVQSPTQYMMPSIREQMLSSNVIFAVSPQCKTIYAITRCTDVTHSAIVSRSFVVHTMEQGMTSIKGIPVIYRMSENAAETCQYSTLIMGLLCNIIRSKVWVFIQSII